MKKTDEQEQFEKNLSDQIKQMIYLQQIEYNETDLLTLHILIQKLEFEIKKLLIYLKKNDLDQDILISKIFNIKQQIDKIFSM